MQGLHVELELLNDIFSWFWENFERKRKVSGLQMPKRDLVVVSVAFQRPKTPLAGTPPEPQKRFLSPCWHVVVSIKVAVTFCFNPFCSYLWWVRTNVPGISKSGFVQAANPQLWKGDKNGICAPKHVFFSVFRGGNVSKVADKKRARVLLAPPLSPPPAAYDVGHQDEQKFEIRYIVINWDSIDQFCYIKTRPKTKDISTRRLVWFDHQNKQKRQNRICLHFVCPVSVPFMK